MIKVMKEKNRELVILLSRKIPYGAGATFPFQ
jgi:hypothetical protein